MKEDVKKRWVKALRSGEYKQGKGVLYNSHTDTYCCLGVLNKIENLNIKNNYVLDGITAEKVGLSSDAQSLLATKNDDGEDFDTIATYIEENL